MRDLLLLVYAAAVGFVAAGVAASFYKMITSEPARFGLLGQGAVAMFSTYLFCGLTGPFIIMDQAIRLRRKERHPVGWLFASFFVAALWSCCSGVVVLELVLSVGDGLV